MPAAPTSKLLTFCRELLINKPSDLTLSKIEKDTGLKVNWLYDIQLSKRPHCSCSKLETLYTYMTGRELQL